MLAAAGIVVTEMRTPTSAPDFAVESERAPAVPASSATSTVYSSGWEMKRVAGRASSVRRSGAEPVTRRTIASANAAAIPAGNPTASARSELARAPLALHERDAEPGERAELWTHYHRSDDQDH